MKISVVIPAYNEEKYLPKTLESIAGLDRKPDEVIVIDGGSTDKTLEIAKEGGARVITVRHRGIGRARQQGLVAAKGDIVAFTDADTVVPKDWLGKIVDTLSQNNVSGMYSVYKVSDGTLLYRWIINYCNPFVFPLGYFFGMLIVGGQNMAFWRLKAIEAGGFPEEFKSVEDFEIMRRLKKVGRVIYRHDNRVISSGRRGNEGIVALTIREAKGMAVYLLTGRADAFNFPDIR